MRIDLHYLRHWAGSGASRIATGISTGWQREHRTSQLREVRPFERGLSIPSRLASAQVNP
jgi:phage tail tape-measure protein